MGLEWLFRSSGGINSQRIFKARFLNELEAPLSKKEIIGVREHSNLNCIESSD